MKFTLSSNALSSRLQTLAKVINSKNSLPILESFLFQIHNGQLTLTASDSENVMQTLRLTSLTPMAILQYPATPFLML